MYVGSFTRSCNYVSSLVAAYVRLPTCQVDTYVFSTPYFSSLRKCGTEVRWVAGRCNVSISIELEASPTLYLDSWHIPYLPPRQSLLSQGFLWRDVIAKPFHTLSESMQDTRHPRHTLPVRPTFGHLRSCATISTAE
jgi:hypothetical protein